MLFVLYSMYSFLNISIYHSERRDCQGLYSMRLDSQGIKHIPQSSLSITTNVHVVVDFVLSKNMLKLRDILTNHFFSSQKKPQIESHSLLYYYLWP